MLKVAILDDYQNVSQQFVNLEKLSGKLKITNESGYFIFDQPISATSPGQACVFYKNDQVLGGGWIT